MKRIAASLLVVCALSLTAIAGDTGMPPKCDTCGSSTTASAPVIHMPELVLAMVLALVTK